MIISRVLIVTDAVPRKSDLTITGYQFPYIILNHHISDYTCWYRHNHIIIIQIKILWKN